MDSKTQTLLLNLILWVTVVENYQKSLISTPNSMASMTSDGLNADLKLNYVKYTIWGH